MNKKKVIFALSSMLLINPVYSNEANDASNFPNKPITVIVPYSAGGHTDLITRAIAREVEEYLGQGFTVKNTTGGGGTIALTEAYRAKPDGYTLAMATSGPMTIKPHAGTVYSYDSFEPVILVTDVPLGLAVSADAPYDDFDGWLDWVKAHPGEFEYGTSGAGLTQHVSMQALQKKIGDIEITHIPFNGGAPAMTALLGDHINGVYLQVTEELPHIQSGKFKLLATSGRERAVEFPDTPNLKELGYDLETGVWSGLVAPSGTPDARIQKIHDAVKKVLDDDEFVATLEKLGTSSSYLGADAFSKKIENDFKNAGQVLKANNQ